MVGFVKHMTSALKQPATYEDLLKVPDDQIAQLVAGELMVSPRPAGDHTFVASTLGAELIGPFQRGRGGPGGWWILDEPEIHLGADILVPDLVGWRRERLPVPSKAPFYELVPDWVCEVLSPSTVSFDRVKKKRVYAREGVQHVWLIDPVAKTLEAFLLREGQSLELGSYSGDVTVRVAPFDAAELDLSAFWIP